MTLGAGDSPVEFPSVMSDVKDRYEQISETALGALRECVGFVNATVESEIVDYFLSDRIDENDSEVHWGSAWFLLRGGSVMEFNSFLSNDKFDVARVDALLLRWTHKNYDFRAASTDSRLKVYGSTADGLSFEMTAVRENCDNLLAFARGWAGAIEGARRE